MKKLLYILSLLLSITLSFAQQYPVKLIPVVIPPYSLKLGDYATSTDNKLQLQVLMTDLMEPQHQTGIKFTLEAGLNAVPFAQSNDFVVGMQPFMLYPGSNITLTNVDLRALFELQNLNGINANQYAQPLSDGVYQFCFQAYDFYTKNNLSQKTCATVFLTQYDPPMLNLPQNAEKVQAVSPYAGGAGIVFQWMPRQIAPNTKYIFTLKELWDSGQSPISGFLSSPPLWREETYAPTLYYGVDKTQLMPGKRYAWQVQAKSGNPVVGANPTDDNGVYKNNGLSEIFFFDYVENCALPTLLMAKNAGRGRVELSWNLAGQPSGLYNVQWRKRGSTSEWQTEQSYQPRYIITGLEDQTEYEYRIGSVCGNQQTFNNTNPVTDGNSAGNAYAFSGIQYFTTDSKDKTNQNYQCGVMPAVDIANKNLYQGFLNPNDTFTAGDFPVTIVASEGSNGVYTGTGFIPVPYLESIRIKVSFKNIKINTDKKLIEGLVETTYDPTEKNIIEVHIIKSIGDILKDVLGIISKDNPTDEDKQTYEAFKQQWNFYLSNIDDINMPPADKAKFEEIKKNLFSASTLPMSAEDKAKAIEAAKEAQKLYEKYIAEFEKLKEKMTAKDRSYILQEDSFFYTVSRQLIKLPKGAEVIFICGDPHLGYNLNGALLTFRTSEGIWNTASNFSTDKKFYGFYLADENNIAWKYVDGTKDHIIYKDKSNKYPTGKQKVNFIHVIQNGETTEYRILQQEVNITENQLAKDTSFTGDIASNIIYDAEKGVQQTITASNCKPQPVDKGELYQTIKDPQGKYEIKVFKNKDGKLNVEFKLLTPSKKGLSEDDKTKIEAQTQELMNEKLQELGWEGKSSDEVNPDKNAPDFGFYVADMTGKQWLNTIGDLGTSVWENATLPENYWKEDEAGHKNSTIKTPALFAGVSDGGIDLVSDYPQLVKLGYDVATKKTVREGIWNGVKTMTPSKMADFAEGAIKQKWENYNFSDKPYMGNHELGKDGVGVVKFAIGPGALVKGIKETGEKFEKASIKTVINSLKRFDIAGEFAKGKKLVENTIEWGGKNFKLKWEKVGNRITFGNRSDLAKILGTTDNIEAHHIMPWKVCEDNEIVQLAALDGFHPNLVENGIGLEKYTKLVGEGLHGNHPAYDDYIKNRLIKYKSLHPNITPKEANEFLQTELIPELKTYISNAKQTDLNLNEYFKVINKNINLNGY